ncbi:META domain-containing protein [Aliiroseovarius sp.]|uniref:META domain-containing protein n=1 Tax=Aliiroseovarius sp. TaxID=1872442 RepID=UPI00261CABC9|nr:META domain-containing protein [Aliiroseovarius sp.]
MKKLLALLVVAVAVFVLLQVSGRDETISGYAPSGVTWSLEALGGTAYPARATISFPEEGRIIGDAPCNGYSATQSAPYPWFEAGPIAATRRACPELAEEAAFFEALARVTLAEVAGEVLILSGEDGFEMVFYARR